MTECTILILKLVNFSNHSYKFDALLFAPRAASFLRKDIAELCELCQCQCFAPNGR